MADHEVAQLKLVKMKVVDHCQTWKMKLVQMLINVVYYFGWLPQMVAEVVSHSWTQMKKMVCMAMGVAPMNPNHFCSWSLL